MATEHKEPSEAEILRDIHHFCKVTAWCNRDNEETWQRLTAEQQAEKRPGICLCECAERERAARVVLFDRPPC